MSNVGNLATRESFADAKNPNHAGTAIMKKHASRLGKVSTGKSCIRFTKLENLNLEVAMELVRIAAKSA